MIEPFKTVYLLIRDRKLHPRLIFRLGYLSFLGLIFGYITIHDLWIGGLHWYILMGVFCTGFIIGLLLFSHVFVIHWDEMKEIVSVGKLDITSSIVLISYVSFRVWVKFFLEEHYSDVVLVSGITFSALFGLMVGRLVGALIAIRRAHILGEELNTPPNT